MPIDRGLHASATYGWQTQTTTSWHHSPHAACLNAWGAHALLLTSCLSVMKQQEFRQHGTIAMEHAAWSLSTAIVLPMWTAADLGFEARVGR